MSTLGASSLLDYLLALIVLVLFITKTPLKICERPGREDQIGSFEIIPTSVEMRSCGFRII